MASGGGSSGGGGGRRPDQSLQGLLRFCAEATADEDTTTDRPIEPMTEEKEERSGKKSIEADKLKEKDKGISEKSDNGTVRSSMERARLLQDAALNNLGLYRFKIPGDGNCMFRAVASQLGSKQEELHPKLRKSAVIWMEKHVDDLLAGGLLDGPEEIEEIKKDGVWPSQAAIVALANVLEVNIAIVQGGDKGDIDIQHVSPFDMPANKQCKEGLIIAYLYTGHYDGVVQDPKTPNPEYEDWLRECHEKTKMGETLARNLQRYGSAYGRELKDEDRDFSLGYKRPDEARHSPDYDRDTALDSLSNRTNRIHISDRDPAIHDRKPTRTVIPVSHGTSSGEWSTYTHKDYRDAKTPTTTVIPVQRSSNRISGSSSYEQHYPSAATNSHSHPKYNSRDYYPSSSPHQDSHRSRTYSQYDNISSARHYSSPSTPVYSQTLPVHSKTPAQRVSPTGHNNLYSSHIPSARHYSTPGAGHRNLGSTAYAREVSVEDYEQIWEFQRPSPRDVERRLSSHTGDEVARRLHRV